MQVFDTHRLLYKNAQIRAYSLATPTTPISFKDDTDTDIGNIVYTNENGYICRSSDMQTVKCLKLSESAIVQVSLDGGNNWPIEWVIEDTLTFVESTDVNSISYYGSDKQWHTWNPITSPNTQLPQYLLASEYEEFKETAVHINDDTCALTVGKWVETILITAAATADTIHFNLSQTRDAQVFFVYSAGITRRYYFETADVTESIVVTPGQTLIVQRNKINNTALISLALIDNLTAAAVQTMINDAIAGSSANTQATESCYQTADGQTFTLTEPINSAMYYVKLRTDANPYTLTTIVLPYPLYPGDYPIVFDIKYDNVTSALP